MHATVFIKFGTMWFLYENETTKRRHVMPRSSAAVGCDVATFDYLEATSLIILIYFIFTHLKLLPYMWHIWQFLHPKNK